MRFESFYSIRKFTVFLIWLVVFVTIKNTTTNNNNKLKRLYEMLLVINLYYYYVNVFIFLVW
jgi:hypothetical protein